MLKGSLYLCVPDDFIDEQKYTLAMRKLWSRGDGFIFLESNFRQTA